MNKIKIRPAINIDIKPDLRGFTLIELLVVVLIIGILAAVALPKYQTAVGRARVVRALPLFRSIVEAQKRYYIANGQYTADLDALDVSVTYASLTQGGSWKYGGTPVGYLWVSPAEAGLSWTSPENVAVDYSENVQRCYGNAPGDVSSRICASLGPEIPGQTSRKGTPFHKLSF